MMTAMPTRRLWTRPALMTVLSHPLTPQSTPQLQLQFEFQIKLRLAQGQLALVKLQHAPQQFSPLQHSQSQRLPQRFQMPMVVLVERQSLQLRLQALVLR